MFKLIYQIYWPSRSESFAACAYLASYKRTHECCVVGTEHRLARRYIDGAEYQAGSLAF